MCNINLEIYIDNRSFGLYKLLKDFSRNDKLLESVKTINSIERAYFNLDTTTDKLKEIDDFIISIDGNEFTLVEAVIQVDDFTNMGYIVIIFNDVQNGIVNKYKLNIPISKYITEFDIGKILDSVFKANRISDCRDEMISLIIKEIKKTLKDDDSSDFLDLVGQSNFTEKIYEWKNKNNDDDSYQSVIIKKHKKA